MVYAWELWQTRHERLRERQERKQAELVEQLRPVVREQLEPVVREELRDELRKWLDQGRSVEDWLNGHPQGNGSQPDKP